MLCSTVRPLDDVLKRGSRFCLFSKFFTMKIHLFQKVVPGRAVFEWICCDFCCWQIDNKIMFTGQEGQLGFGFARGSFVALLSRCPKEGISSGFYLLNLWCHILRVLFTTCDGLCRYEVSCKSESQWKNVSVCVEQNAFLKREVFLKKKSLWLYCLIKKI